MQVDDFIHSVQPEVILERVQMICSPLFKVNMLKVFSLSFYIYYRACELGFYSISQHLFHQKLVAQTGFNSFSCQCCMHPVLCLFIYDGSREVQTVETLIVHLHWIKLIKGSWELDKKHLLLMHKYGNNKQTVLALEYSAGSLTSLFYLNWSLQIHIFQSIIICPHHILATVPLSTTLSGASHIRNELRPYTRTNANSFAVQIGASKTDCKS